MAGAPTTDDLIRELVASDRAARAEEIQQIAGTLSTARFHAAFVRVPLAEQVLIFQGTAAGPEIESLAYHVAKRIAW